MYDISAGCQSDQLIVEKEVRKRLQVGEVPLLCLIHWGMALGIYLGFCFVCRDSIVVASRLIVRHEI